MPYLTYCACVRLVQAVARQATTRQAVNLMVFLDTMFGAAASAQPPAAPGAGEPAWLPQAKHNLTIYRTCAPFMQVCACACAGGRVVVH
jgi:hypothetical protein